MAGNDQQKAFTMIVKNNRYAVWTIRDGNIPPDLKEKDGTTTKQQLINALSALDITAENWKRDLMYDKAVQGWSVKLNERLRERAQTAVWGSNNTHWFQAKYERSNEDAEKRTVFLAGLSPGGAESVENLKAAIQGWCQMKAAKIETVSIAPEGREERRAKIVAASMADKNKLIEKGFTYLMGDGVIVYDAKETETEARERLWQRTLQIAAVPMGLRAGDLDEIKEWMGAEAVKVPANLATGKRGDIAHFTFDSEATANEYAGSIVTFRNIQRKVVRLFEKEGNTFKRVYCCWTCGDSSHMKQE